MKTSGILAFLAATASGVSAVTTTLPKSAGLTTSPTAIPVKGSYDGGMKRFERSSKLPLVLPALSGEPSVVALRLETCYVRAS